MASFQMLSPAAESFFTYFYNALCSLNPFFGCPYELEDKRCAPFSLEVRTSWVRACEGSAAVGTLSLDLVVRFCAFTLRQDRTLTHGMP